MSEIHREQLPLLNEDISDEELRYGNNNPKFRRFKAHYRSRARYNLKGAAQILSRWPDFWSASLMYWWAGISMIAVIIFLVYNSAIAYAMLPPSNFRHFSPHNFHVLNEKSASNLPDVFMHIIANNSNEISLDNYLPSIHKLSTNYDKFNYKLIIVLNDTVMDIYPNDPGENNEIAMNDLWSKEKSPQRYNVGNISVEYISLTKLLDNSPINKIWRHLPQHFIEFLVRTISVWNKGGIAFNPVVLTPYTPHTMYIDKLHNILVKYSEKKTEGHPKLIDQTQYLQSTTSPPKKYTSNYTKSKVNNIQDVIKNLDSHSHEMEYPLDAAEDNNINTVVEFSKGTKTQVFTNIIAYNGSDAENISATDSSNLLRDTETNILNYIFHKNGAKSNGSDTIRIRKSEVSNNELDNSNRNTVDINESLLPMIISAKAIHENNGSEKVKTMKIYETLPDNKIFDELSIDLTGNIIATATACHAFIGTIFSNLNNYSEDQSLTDFIIAELSLFCKGVLSSCKGIDIIIM